MGRVIGDVAAELDRTVERRLRLGAETGELFEAHLFGPILGSLSGDRAEDGSADPHGGR